VATPMTADEFVAALRAEGLHVVEHAGWRTHNRAGHGAWGDIHGAVIHHTGGSGPGDGDVVYNGRSDLPGPCAHSYLAKSGTVTMTGNGRANHAGGGSPAVLSAVINESYDGVPPATHFHDGSSGAADGNASFYGLEVSNLGTKADAYPAVQYDAAVRWAAAICRHHAWSAKSTIGHKEWSDWKPDPIYSMTQFRADVAARLAHPASWNPGSTTPPEEDDPMAGMTPRQIYDAVWRTDVMTPPDGTATATNPTWAAESVLRDAANQARALRATVQAQGVAITQLAAALAAHNGSVDVDALIERIETAIQGIDVHLTTS